MKTTYLCISLMLLWVVPVMAQAANEKKAVLQVVQQFLMPWKNRIVLLLTIYF